MKSYFFNYSAKMLLRKLSWLCPRLKVRLVLVSLACLGVVGSVAFWVAVIPSSLRLLKECSDESSTIYLNNLVSTI